MIQFFRRIRQQLLSQSRFSKYLLYAIGEIVLVMVGILLALQVNNWNETRIKEMKISSLLREMIVNLESDYESLTYESNIHSQALASCKVILKVFADNLPYNDSLSKHFAATNYYTVFKFTDGAYQSLKSVGVESLNNRTLSNNIIEFYDRWYEIYRTNQSNLTHDVLTTKRNFYMNKFSKFHLFSLVDGDFVYAGNMEPLDFESLKRDSEYRYWLNSLVKSHEQILWLNNFAAETNESLRAEIRNEINDTY